MARQPQRPLYTPQGCQTLAALRREAFGLAAALVSCLVSHRRGRCLLAYGTVMNSQRMPDSGVRNVRNCSPAVLCLRHKGLAVWPRSSSPLHVYRFLNSTCDARHLLFYACACLICNT